MNLGERLYELRSSAGLSQGEFADKLDVSRQAVSKWENNSAVPELDKLLKMSELFNISLDELVKGEKPAEKVTEYVTVREVISEGKKNTLPTRKIVALVLFGMAFLTALILFTMGGLWGVLYAVPFAVFGLVCWFCEKYTGLKCLWVAGLMINAFCNWATGISVFNVLRTFSWTYDMNYWILVFSWALVLFNLFVVVYTAVKLGKEAPKNPGKVKKSLISSIVSLLGVTGINYLIRLLFKYLYENVFSGGDAMHDFSLVMTITLSVMQFVFQIVIAVTIVYIIRYVKIFRKK